MHFFHSFVAGVMTPVVCMLFRFFAVRKRRTRGGAGNPWTIEDRLKEGNLRKGRIVGDDAGQSKSIGYKALDKLVYPHAAACHFTLEIFPG